jgi:hypothetical protein
MAGVSDISSAESFNGINLEALSKNLEPSMFGEIIE